MIEILLLSAMAICLIGLIICGYFQIRNHKVYYFRRNLIDSNIDIYKRMKSYDEMLYSIKRLTVENFIKK